VSPRWGLLRQPNFRLLWIGETTSSLGSSVSAFALPLVALTVLHAGALTVSAVAAAAWVPWLVIGLPAGALVDRLPRRRVLITADVVSILAFGSVVLAVVLHVLTAVQLVGAAFVAGGATVLFSTAYRAFLPALVGPGDTLEANAKLQGSEQVTHVVGPGLAGVVVSAFHAAGGVLVDVASFVVSLVCLVRIKVTETVTVTDPKRMRHAIADGMRLAFGEPLLRVNAIFGCMSNFMLTGYQAILLVFLVRTAGLSAGMSGLLLALGSVGGVIGAALARRAARVLGSARAVLLGKLVCAPFGLLIPLTSRGAGVVFLVVGNAVLIGGIVAGNVIWSGWVQSYYPTALLGRISTSSQLVNYGAIPLGAMTAGALAEGLGTRSALWILLSGVVAASAILLMSPLRTMRDLPTREELPALMLAS